jgi:hypothetical protein
MLSGTAAAGIQAGIGNVAAGSLFATATSAGMGGAGWVVLCGVVQGVGAAIGVAGGAAAAARRGLGQQTSEDEEEEEEDAGDDSDGS